MVPYLLHHICTFTRAEVCESDHERPWHVHVFSRKFWLSASTRVCVGQSWDVLCRTVLCQPVSCRNWLVLNGKCTSHRIHVKLNVYVTFEGTWYWMYVTLNVCHLECMSLKVYARVKRTRFLNLSFPFFFLFLNLQDLNTSARCIRRGLYVGNFCANGRFSRPVLPFLDCRPPLLVRVN